MSYGPSEKMREAARTLRQTAAECKQHGKLDKYEQYETQARLMAIDADEMEREAVKDGRASVPDLDVIGGTVAECLLTLKAEKDRAHTAGAPREEQRKISVAITQIETGLLWFNTYIDERDG